MRGFQSRCQVVRVLLGNDLDAEAILEFRKDGQVKDYHIPVIVLLEDRSVVVMEKIL